MPHMQPLRLVGVQSMPTGLAPPLFAALDVLDAGSVVRPVPLQ